MPISLVTNSLATNTNLPISLTSADRRLIMAADPICWMLAEEQQMQIGLGDSLTLIGDLTGKAWAPTLGQLPEAVEAEDSAALRFAVNTDGEQALGHVGDADLLPESPSGLTIVALVKCDSGMAVDRSMIFGSQDATPLALFVNQSNGKAFFMSKYNDGAKVMNGDTDVTDSAWHTIMVAVTGTAAGGQMFVDGVADSADSGNTFTWNANRKLLIGAAGPAGATSYFEGDLGALLVLPTDIRGNAALLAAVNAEFAAEQAKRT